MSLKGTVTIGWSIVRGTVLNVHTVENTTQSAALAACFEAGVHELQFDEGINLEVPSYTWVVSDQ